MLSVTFKPFILSAIMLNVIMLSVVMFSAVAPVNTAPSLLKLAAKNALAYSASPPLKYNKKRFITLISEGQEQEGRSGGQRPPRRTPFGETFIAGSGTSYSKGRSSTVDLLVLSISDQLLFILRLNFTFLTKQPFVMRRSTVLNRPFI